MRSFTPLALLIVLACAATPLAASGPTPAGCLPSCEVRSTSFAYASPVLVVESGATVTWASADGLVHTSTDPAAYCFHTAYNAAGGWATFTIRDGALFARAAWKVDEVPCTGAEPLPEGGFRLSYVCLHHPMMRGELVVLPP